MNEKDQILALQARVKLLETGLINLIEVAECCDDWGVFPQEPLDSAYEILNDNQAL